MWRRRPLRAPGCGPALSEREYGAAASALADLQERATRLGEAANGAKWELANRTREATDAGRKATAAEAASGDAAEYLREYAGTLYQEGGPLGILAPLFASGGPQEIADRASTLAIVGELRNQQFRSAVVVAGTATSLRAAADRALELQRAAAAAAASAHEVAQAQFERADAAAAALAARRSALATELAGLRATSAASEKARLDGLARVAAQASATPRPQPTQTNGSTSAPATSSTAPSTSSTPSSTTTAPPSTSTTTHPTSTSTTTTAPSTTSTTSTTTSTSSSTSTTPSSTTSSTPPPPPPPPASGVEAVLAYARAQLGKPYEWGADGPDSFDCSGLTMTAWQQAGVYLSHYTGAQWAETERVALADLMPGDLVFYGSTGETSYHVGLYVGDGQMIEAPRTGLDVRYASIYRDDLLPFGGRP